MLLINVLEEFQSILVLDSISNTKFYSKGLLSMIRVNALILALSQAM